MLSTVVAAHLIGVKLTFFTSSLSNTSIICIKTVNVKDFMLELKMKYHCGIRTTCDRYILNLDDGHS